MDIGNKIKNFRRIKNLAQEGLAERTDLLKSYISRVESEHVSSSMETFLNIIEVLETAPSEFFKDSRNEKVLYEKEEQVVYDEYDEGYILNWSVSKSNEYDMEPLILTLKPDASYKDFNPSESDTSIYCMSGQITLNLDKEVYQAQEEDVLYFRIRDNHRLSNESNNETRILIVATTSYLQGGSYLEPLLSLRSVSKNYGGLSILDDIDIDIKSRCFYILLGPSGCGKTATLKLIAGFKCPDSGEVIYQNKPTSDLSPNKRKVDTVFQNYALFPRLDVYDNIAFGLKLKKLSKTEIDQRVTEALKLVKLSGYEKRSINEMSGGQRQRAAIARVIVNEPEILLLDESLSALDLKLRTEIQYELRELQSRLGVTFIFVTHDQEETLALSDFLFILRDRKVQQFDTSTNIYDEPVNRFVADFVRESNIIGGRMVRDYVVNIYGQDFGYVGMGIPENKGVEVVIWLEDTSLIKTEEGSFKITVDSILFKEVHYEICCIDSKGYEWVIQTTKKVEIGNEVGLYFDPEAIHIMVPGETEEKFDKHIESYEEVDDA